MRNVLRRSAAMAILGALVAAPGARAELEWVQPQPGEEVTWMPTEIAVEWDAALGGEIVSARLNGVPVTDRFESVARPDGRATALARDLWIEDGLALGSNELLVQVGETNASLRFAAVGDAHSDAVAQVRLGASAGFGLEELPGVVTGPPRGGGLTGGSLDVLSLGAGGEIILQFVDNVVYDGPGPDLAVFENPFVIVNPSTLTVEGVFAEPAAVAVSQDGDQWSEFPCVPERAADDPGCAGRVPVWANADDPDAPHATAARPLDPAAWTGVPVADLDPEGAGGDVFDLADLGVGWVRYVRIRDLDAGGLAGPTSAGFDLDAATALYSVPATDADGDGVPDAILRQVPEPASGWLGAALVLGLSARRWRSRQPDRGSKSGRHSAAAPRA